MVAQPYVAAPVQSRAAADGQLSLLREARRRQRVARSWQFGRTRRAGARGVIEICSAACTHKSTAIVCTCVAPRGVAPPPYGRTGAHSPRLRLHRGDRRLCAAYGAADLRGSACGRDHPRARGPCRAPTRAAAPTQRAQRVTGAEARHHAARDRSARGRQRSTATGTTHAANNVAPPAGVAPPASRGATVIELAGAGRVVVSGHCPRIEATWAPPAWKPGILRNQPRRVSLPA